MSFSKSAAQTLKEFEVDAGTSLTDQEKEETGSSLV
jgi:hypothetical protein